MIRVLIADDSPTVRHYLRAILSRDPEIEIVGEAKDGAEEVEYCRALNPDIVITDIGMPRMDGYQAIKKIMSEMPRPILVLTSTASDIELGISYKALQLGALMVTGKPHGLPEENPQADELVSMVKTLAGVKVIRRRFRGEKPPKPRSLPKAEVIAIGASTGGPQALYQILKCLPEGFPLPILVIQHMSSGFTEGFVRWLNESSQLRIKVAEEGEEPKAGFVYLALEDHHMVIGGDGLIHILKSPKVDGHRPSATLLFDSVARHYGKGAVGVLLTGMGSDGARGLKTIRDAGGYTIAQDEKTSVVFGMPREAVKIGAAREVLPLSWIPQRLLELANSSR